MTQSSVGVHLSVNGARVASVRQGAGPRTVYLYRDRLGSVVATTLAGGVKGASYRYGVYGAVEASSGDAGDAASELGYAGALRLSGSLLLMGARVYHSGMRTFLQPDPLHPYTYGYTPGDPVNYTDPTGMEAGEAPPKDCEGDTSCQPPPAPAPDPDPDGVKPERPTYREDITVTGQRRPGYGPGWNGAGDRLGNRGGGGMRGEGGGGSDPLRAGVLDHITGAASKLTDKQKAEVIIVASLIYVGVELIEAGIHFAPLLGPWGTAAAILVGTSLVVGATVYGVLRVRGANPFSGRRRCAIRSRVRHRRGVTLRSAASFALGVGS